MKNLKHIATTSTATQMSDLTAEIVNTNSIQLFLQQCEFNNIAEVADGVRQCYEAIISDAYLRSDDVKKNSPILQAFYNRYKKHYTSISFEGYCENIAQSMWLSFFAKAKRDETLKKLNDTTPDQTEYEKAANVLATMYGLSSDDLEKLRLFVYQVKKGRDFPDSLRRMLYLYSEKKKTGKTTFARVLAEVLNGYSEYEDSNAFNSQLSIEMQIQNYATPKVAQYNVVVLDECFYADMAKTYARFKEIITSRDGEARLPYGQPFRWEGVRNYIATSNENLSTFIADWSDRRYYNIEFNATPQECSEADLFLVVKHFVANVEVTDYTATINMLYDKLEVKGTKSVTTDEYATEMQQNIFVDWLLSLDCDCNKKFCVQNRLTTKKIVDFFAGQKGSEAGKQRKEIERAFVSVYGEKIAAGYWLLPDIKIAAQSIKDTGLTAAEKAAALPF